MGASLLASRLRSAAAVSVATAVDPWAEPDELTTRKGRAPWAALWGLVAAALVAGLVRKAVTYGDNGTVAFNRDVFREESARCTKVSDASRKARQACWSEASVPGQYPASEQGAAAVTRERAASRLHIDATAAPSSWASSISVVGSGSPGKEDPVGGTGCGGPSRPAP
jgi:hypothetical protein